MDGVIEFLGYLFGFWLFLLSSKFRQHVLTDWRDRGRLGKLFIPIEVISSTCCGLAPFFVLYLLLFEGR